MLDFNQPTSFINAKNDPCTLLAFIISTRSNTYLLQYTILCDPFRENVPKVAETTIEIWQKVCKDSLLICYLSITYLQISNICEK